MEQASANRVSKEAILSQVDKICASPGFRNSDRLCQFLRYTVNQTLLGQGDSLKEHLIGVEVYGRKLSYNPGQDSIVRTEARRLRNRLKEYYERGADTDVLISFRTGTYKPVFSQPGGLHAVHTSIERSASDGRPRQELRTGYSIAVLPFADDSRTVETAAFAAGLTDEIIYRISLSEGCRVVSVDAIRGSHSSIDELAMSSRKRDVQQAIYGSIQQEGRRFTILAHGFNPLTHEIWTQKLQAEPQDGALRDLLEHAASALIARIGPHRSEIRNMEQPVDPACVAIFPELFSAETLLDTCDTTSIRLALNRFRSLTKRVPNSARSFNGIVQCHYLLAQLNELIPPEAVLESRSAALCAIELDDRMAESYAALGCAQVLELSFGEAEKSFATALELAPHTSPIIRQNYAHLLIALGNFDEAFLQLRGSQGVDPFSGQQKLACARSNYLSGRFPDGMCGPSFANEFGGVPNRALLFQANIAIHLGKVLEATQCAEDILRESNGTPALTAEIAEILALAGNHSKAESLIGRLGLLDPQAPISRVGQARLCLAMKQSDRCVGLLAEALQRREPQLYALGVDPRFACLREEAFFLDLLSDLQLPYCKSFQ